MKLQGILSDAEFQLAKGKLLGKQGSAPGPACDTPLPKHVPRYWHNKDIHESFKTRQAAHPEFAAQLQVLLDKTFKAKKTRDRHGAMPTGLKLIKAQRVEDSVMWGRYLATLEMLLAKNPQGCTPVNMLDDNPDAGFVQTSENMDDEYNERLDSTINEHYLWHQAFGPLHFKKIISRLFENFSNIL